MADATVASKEAELERLNAAIDAVRLGVSYTQGDRSLTRVDLPKLEESRARVARELRELRAAAAGCSNPAAILPTFY